jgi:hypothetical protein
MDDAKNIYITDTNVIIYEKEGRAEQLAYNCSNTPDDPATYFHKIQCGSTASDVMPIVGGGNLPAPPRTLKPYGFSPGLIH